MHFRQLTGIGTRSCPSATPETFRWLLGLLAALTAATTAGFTIAGADSVAVPLCVATQGVGVLWLAALGWSPTRKWASVPVILAGAWTLAFVVPALLYALDGDLLDVTARPVESLALINVSLFCLAVPVALLGRASKDDRAPGPDPVRVRLGTGSPAWLWIWALVGLIGFLLVFQGAGGVVNYVTNLDREGQFTLGRVYFVWMALFVRYAAQIALYRRWSAGARADWRLLALMGASIGVTGLLGARLFVAFALVEMALFYALVRRPLPGRVMLPVVALVSCAVILVGGAAKRYQNYRSANEGDPKGFAAYLVDEGRSELAAAYANNYADGVRLVILARATVPDHADFEQGKLLLRYAAQPIPRKWRWEPSRSAALKRAFYPGGGFSHAMPLQASAYIQGGAIGVIVVFLVLGGAVSLLHRRVSGMRQATITAVVLATTTPVAVASYLRSSDPGGFALALIEVVGLSVVAFTADGGLGRMRSLGRLLEGPLPAGK